MFGTVSKILKPTPTINMIQKVFHNSFKSPNVSASDKKGLPLSKVVDVLNDYASTSLAESWDNVGLLIEPTEKKDITHILLTNDLTEDVMQEAIDVNADMIISYHPPIFAPLKTITTKSWKERIAAKCLENRIALYSPHTSFDSIRGGVNDWLASAFNVKESRPIEPGEVPENGMGRLCILQDNITVEEAVELIKKHTGLEYVRLARKRGSDKPIKKIGLCAGSGASVLKRLYADLFVTGEMLHHDILDAVHRGTSVILTNHSDSERGFLKNVFAQKLTDMLDNSVVVSVSDKDEDPLKTV